MIDAVVAQLSRLACGPSVAWHSEPHTTRQRIYFANHASHLDFVVLWASLPAAQRRAVRPVAGRDYWERTAARRYLAREVFRAILVERTPADVADRRAAATAAVDAMVREMGSDTSVIVFPEGTRSEDGRLRPFKSGLYHLSRAVPQAELVPVYLHNLNRILPRGESLPVPMLSRVTFGLPLPVEPREAKADFLQRARAALLVLEDA